MNEKLASYGQWTYRGAWALEIVASIIGLTTGIALGYRGFAASEHATSMDLVLASAPFFMVAIAELTKIPIATLLFGVSWIWKPVVLLFLMVLAGITFETVLLGLERASTMREVQYTDFANKTKALEQERMRLQSAANALSGSDSEAKARANLEDISTLADKERKELRARVSEVDEELLAATTLSPGAARAKEVVAEKQAALEELIARRDREIKDAVKQFEGQRDSYVERINNARAAGDADSVKRNEEALNRLANPRLKKEAEFQPRVTAFEAEAAAARAEFETLRKSSPAMTPEDRERLEKRRNDLEQLYDTTNADWDKKLDEARLALATAQEEQSRKSETLASNQQRQDRILVELNNLESERLPIARDDQIRRLAGKWYGVTPENVTDEQAGNIAVVWFSSLALIAALAGPITAMVALALQRIGSQDQRENTLSRLLRRMLLRWRWRRVRTVRVPTEVFVEKEVEKRIEVPVEKVIKEILYVPVLTDDPDALRRALSQELPPEVANLVKVSGKRSVPSTNGLGKFEQSLEQDLNEELAELSIEPAKKRGRKGARSA